MNIYPADYHTLAEQDERLAILFGRRYLFTRPRGSLIDQMTYTNADPEGIGLAQAILRQAERFPSAFSHILDAYDRRMEGILPLNVLKAEAQGAGWGENFVAFLYGISPSMYSTCDLDGPHALLVAVLVGDIEQHVMDAVAEVKGRPLSLSWSLPSASPDMPESEARELLCAHFVGHGSAYMLLRRGVEATVLASNLVHREALVEAVEGGVEPQYAVQALLSGIRDVGAIVYGYHQGVAPEYLTEVAA